MNLRSATLAACAALALAAAVASAQQPSASPAPARPSSAEPVTLKAAVVALIDNPMVRQEFETDLVATARAHRYDAITSYDLVPKVNDVRDRNFLKTLTEKGVHAVLMVRPAAVGAGSSLDAVKKEVSPKVLADMRSFAKEVSASDGNDLIAVVHLAIYMIDTGTPEPVSSGAVWLDEPVKDRAEGIARLNGLIAANIDAARPAIRKHYGLPPLD
jgi:hypothetical protein